ncbi:MULTISPECIES: hypothetical protein [unclassified Paenibacillus]|uniref:hypothetical protein n=1 Tax=unclassified Paenibacillus TaxID=185978 RepID=UPI0009714748|nr:MULTISPECIES: hypothetical protein [unclassified Paenibacillus]
MKRLLAQLEAERRRLNELGVESLEQGIPLAENKAVQAQSRKIDQLIIRLQGKSAGRGQHQR